MGPLGLLLLGGGGYALYKRYENPAWTPFSALLATPGQMHDALARVRMTSIPTPAAHAALDPGMTEAQVEHCNHALAFETSPAALADLAEACVEEGFENSAMALAEKAEAVGEAKAAGADDDDVTIEQAAASNVVTEHVAGEYVGKTCWYGQDAYGHCRPPPRGGSPGHPGPGGGGGYGGHGGHGGGGYGGVTPQRAAAQKAAAARRAQQQQQQAAQQRAAMLKQQQRMQQQMQQMRQQMMMQQMQQQQDPMQDPQAQLDALQQPQLPEVQDPNAGLADADALDPLLDPAADLAADALLDPAVVNGDFFTGQVGKGGMVAEFRTPGAAGRPYYWGQGGMMVAPSYGDALYGADLDDDGTAALLYSQQIPIVRPLPRGWLARRRRWW